MELAGGSRVKYKESRDFVRFFREKLWLLEEPFCFESKGRRTFNLSSFTTDSASKLDVFRHDGHSFGVDGTQVCVFEETDKVSFAGFL